MQLRRGFRYPPFTSLANVLVHGESLEEVLGWTGHLKRWMRMSPPEGVKVMGPAPAPIPRIKRIYRYHLLLRAERRDVLSTALRGLLAFAEAAGIPRRNLVVDMDALHLM
jgi:primosomal protein N' (replication factor Y) (superfamily II helicase)